MSMIETHVCLSEGNCFFFSSEGPPPCRGWRLQALLFFTTVKSCLEGKN